MDASLIDAVREASDLTMREGTARVVYEQNITMRQLSAAVDILNPVHADPPVGNALRAVWSVVGSGLKAAERGLSDLASGRSEGVVDFTGGGCLLRRRYFGLEYETYVQPGRMIQRRSNGSWREKPLRPFEGSLQWSPIWLVELLRGATEATAVEQERIGDSLCRHIRGSSDPERASAQSKHGMDVPQLPDDRERAVPIDAWIDATGRVHRMIASFAAGEPDEVVKEWTAGSWELTLSDFGQTPPPAKPTTQ